MSILAVYYKLLWILIIQIQPALIVRPKTRQRRGQRLHSAECQSAYNEMANTQSSDSGKK